MVLAFLFSDPNFCSAPEAKPQNRFSNFLIHMKSVPGYCVLRRITLDTNYTTDRLLNLDHKVVNKHK